MIKHYTYISDSKLDMIFGQIPQSFVRRTAVELKIDLKIISLSLRRSQTEENRFGRVRVATEYLRREAALGTISEYPPKPWLLDELSITLIRTGGDALLYMGSRGISTVILVGSRRSVLGANFPGDEAPRGTWLMIEDLLARSYEELPSVHDTRIATADPLCGRQMPSDALDLAAIERLAYDCRGIARPMSFVAHPVVQRRTIGGRIEILASPLYIAEADEWNHPG
jgi:hypothetical protein